MHVFLSSVPGQTMMPRFVRGTRLFAFCAGCLSSLAWGQGIPSGPGLGRGEITSPELIAPLTLTPPAQTESMRRAQIRAFVSANSPGLPDSEGGLRRRMSREEREALRESLNEAVRGAYGRRARWPSGND